MTEIVIQGIGGRMGHVLCDMIAQREDCCVVAGIDMKDGEQNGIPVYDSLEKLNGKGDVIIDFSSPAAVEKALPYCPNIILDRYRHAGERRIIEFARAEPPLHLVRLPVGLLAGNRGVATIPFIARVDFRIQRVERIVHAELARLDAPG